MVILLVNQQTALSAMRCEFRPELIVLRRVLM
jgi:hypothetical protein